MSDQLVTEILTELEALRLIDPHTHINPLSAASATLADILGYHYYTELAHSAGLAKDRIEEPGIDPREKVRRLVPWLATIENTAQYSWLLEMCRVFFNFQENRVTTDNWESLYEASLKKMQSPDWEQQVLQISGLDQVYLTNDFDDPLSGFDTAFYIPCLRTDDLVFHLTRPEVRARLQKCVQQTPTTASQFREALGKLFEHFTGNNARACAISLPPSFSPKSVSDDSAAAILAKVWSGEELSDGEAAVLSCFVFWCLAEKCAEYRLPFDLMIGVNRRVFEAGVYQGQDLYDKRVSLIQYKALFNAFPQVTFPVSVLSETSNQELVSYAWIFPNVVTNGHWWYSNIPVFIEKDTRARLQAVPKTKQIGYYSDM
ncbi:MAG: glucuronate isomerase, partial [Planctomycetaceae bacterium]|nr:glucuronate isomerase [Planctomycetaceae bacterium]